MNVLTCQQVEEHLDLLAAGACDRPTRRAVEKHLAGCPTCAASYADSQRLQGLLDMHWNEADQLRRLHKRINEAARQTHRPRLLVGPWMQRAAALAALLLLTFGLSWLMPNGSETPASANLTMALVTLRGDRNMAEMKAIPAMAPNELASDRGGAKGLVLKLPKDQLGPVYRRELQQRQRRGDLPLPPPLLLGLELKNTGWRPLEIRFGGSETQLSLDVQGPGVLRLKAPAKAAFLHSQTLLLAPGQRRWLPLGRLVAGWPGHVEYIYLTERGEYTLTIRLKAVVDSKLSWLTSGPISIRVGGE